MNSEVIGFTHEILCMARAESSGPLSGIKNAMSDFKLTNYVVASLCWHHGVVTSKILFPSRGGKIFFSGRSLQETFLLVISGDLCICLYLTFYFAKWKLTG